VDNPVDIGARLHAKTCGDVLHGRGESLHLDVGLDEFQNQSLALSHYHSSV
jgi:hypothetical protein